MIESFKLSEKEKLQLIQLKKKTGIEHWNVLCRWAFCLSIREDSIPPKENLSSDSNVEMTWKTFAGEHAEVYRALLNEKMHRDYGNDSLFSKQDIFRLYLNRGISYLNNSVSEISDLNTLLTESTPKN
jgi:DNA sulfur modification protein DndE